SQPPPRFADARVDVAFGARRSVHCLQADPAGSAAGPHLAERAERRDEGGRCGPETAALSVSVDVIANHAEDLPLAFLGRRDEQDLVGASARPIVEVRRVPNDLGSKATRLLSAAIPLEMDQYLAVLREEPAPAIWDRASLIAFGVGIRHAVFADPVIQAAVRQPSSYRSQVDEELVGL